MVAMSLQHHCSFFVLRIISTEGAIMAIQALFGLSGFQSDVNGIIVTQERIARLQMPETFTAEHLKTAQRDLEILAEVAQAAPDDMAALQNALIQNDFQTARDLTVKLGIDEAQMIAKGGGGVWLVVAVIAVGAALLLASDSPTPHEPAPVSPDGGTHPDGGTG
jgi:hypothetical protein